MENTLANNKIKYFKTKSWFCLFRLKTIVGKYPLKKREKNKNNNIEKKIILIPNHSQIQTTHTYIHTYKKSY